MRGRSTGRRPIRSSSWGTSGRSRGQSSWPVISAVTEARPTSLGAAAGEPRALPGDDLAAQRALSRGRVISTDHGEELFIGDADRQEQFHVDTGLSELA